jgi:hypothetical protein
MHHDTLLNPELNRAFDGVVPFVVGTCDGEATPNITFMSQLFYVDEQHLALSYQFMNKTWRNLQTNPVFMTFVTNPDTLSMWKIKLQFLEEKKEGPVFEDMEMQLLALATPQHIHFSLHSALICKVLSVEKVFSISNA